MEPKRITYPEILPGESITRFHLTEAMGAFDAQEIHIAHHPDGDLKEDAQWYDIYVNPTQYELDLLQRTLGIDFRDWSILMCMLGSFRWALYQHPLPSERSEIRLDDAALKAGEWTTTYF